MMIISISVSLDTDCGEGLHISNIAYTVQGEIGTLFKDEFECHLKCCDQ